MNSILDTAKGTVCWGAAIGGGVYTGSLCREICSLRHIIDLSNPLIMVSVRGGKDWTQIMIDTALQINETSRGVAFSTGAGIFALTTRGSVRGKETRPWELDVLRGACLGAAFAGLACFASAKADSSSSNIGLHVLAATISGCISGTAGGILGHFVGSTLRKLNLVPAKYSSAT